MTHTAIEKIKELEEQKSTLVEEAKKEAIAQAQAAVDVLSALGYDYTIVQDGKQSKKKNGSRRGSRKPDPNKRCPVCNFQTDPPHDARHHRNQAVKAAFTPEELTEKGMKITGEAPTTELVPEAAE